MNQKKKIYSNLLMSEVKVEGARENNLEETLSTPSESHNQELTESPYFISGEQLDVENLDIEIEPELYENGSLSQATLKSYLERLLDNQPLTIDEVKLLCDSVVQILLEEPNIANISTPVTICGDIHGQFYDLIELFRRGGPLPETKYLFLGDFVDRGNFGIQVVELLLTYKVLYPDRVTMLRGNHESRTINKFYGFLDECRNEYGDSDVWEILNRVFDRLPLATLIDNRVFCVHGGLSPSITTVDQISLLNRVVEPPSDGAIPDLLWSDPVDNSDFERSNRGAGHFWGSNVSKVFCQNNNLQYIIRAHQLVMDGYEWTHDNYVLTLFSAPNYIYRSNNKAAILKLRNTDERPSKDDFDAYDAVKEPVTSKRRNPFL